MTIYPLDLPSLRSRIIRLALACVGVVSFAQAEMAAEKADGLAPVRLMERRYRSAKTLQATFLERYTESGRVVRVESGVAYFRRPGKMRWEYAVPEQNLFLIDGKTAWFYVPADHTVTRVPAKQSGDWRTPLALLAGEMKVSRVCARVEPAPNEKPESAGNAVFTCILRGSEQAKKRGAAALQANPAEEDQSVLLEIGRETGELARIMVRDKGGIGVEFRFAQWRDDPVIAEALFHFEVPRGVAIVNGELPGEQGNAP
jgi:outer membrane lipoprotein-sorting protein